MAAVAEAGWPVVWSGGDDQGQRYASVEPPTGAAIVEITARTDALVGMADLVRDAAIGWDGSDPVRSLGG
jgi:hypothetical protein